MGRAGQKASPGRKNSNFDATSKRRWRGLSERNCLLARFSLRITRAFVDRCVSRSQRAVVDCLPPRTQSLCSFAAIRGSLDGRRLPLKLARY
jgi:hypothetical protein